MSLTGKQRSYLKGLAHNLSALVQVGKAGVTPQVVEDIRSKVAHHELVKVRIDATDQDEYTGLVNRLGAELQVEIVQSIGHTLVLYAPNKEEPKIALPG